MGTQIVRVPFNETNVWIAKTILWENNVNSASKFPMKLYSWRGEMREGSRLNPGTPLQPLVGGCLSQKYKIFGKNTFWIYSLPLT